MARKNIISNKTAKRILITLMSLVTIIAVVTVGIYAFLTDSAGPVTNEFKPSTVDIDLKERFENNIKKDVYVSNPKTETAIECYVRVLLICNWYTDITVDGETVQQVVGKSSWNIDDTANSLDMNTEDWFKGSDGYYYYKHVLDVGNNTTNLINSIELVVDDNDGTYQGLEILSEAIQSKGMAEDGALFAVEKVWPAVKVVDGKLAANN